MRVRSTIHAWILVAAFYSVPPRRASSCRGRPARWPSLPFWPAVRAATPASRPARPASSGVATEAFLKWTSAAPAVMLAGPAYRLAPCQHCAHPCCFATGRPRSARNAWPSKGWNAGSAVRSVTPLRFVSGHAWVAWPSPRSARAPAPPAVPASGRARRARFQCAGPEAALAGGRVISPTLWAPIGWAIGGKVWAMPLWQSIQVWPAEKAT